MMVLVKVRIKLPKVFRFHWVYLIFGHTSAYGTSLTRDRTHIPCNGSTESLTLNHQQSPPLGGDSEGQGSLAWCNSWGKGVSDMTWQLNNNNSPNIVFFCRKKYKTFPPDFFPFFLIYCIFPLPFLFSFMVYLQMHTT